MTEKIYKTSFIVVYVINKHGAAIVASYEGLYLIFSHLHLTKRDYFFWNETQRSF